MEEEIRLEPPKTDKKIGFESLVFLAGKKELVQNKEFFKVARGEVSLGSLPETLNQPPLLTSEMLDLRDFAQTDDVEQHTAVYEDPKTGELYDLGEPVEGKFDYREGVYKCGPLPKTESVQVIIDIHSHPAYLKLMSGMTDEEFADFVLAGNVPSSHDFGGLMTFSKDHPEEKVMGTIMVVGKDLSFMVCRTKQTPKKKEATAKKGEGRLWNFAELVNGIFEIQRKIKEGNPEASQSEIAIQHIVETCKAHNLGLYLLRMRDHASTKDIWTRFHPWPKDFEKSLEELLK